MVALKASFVTLFALISLVAAIPTPGSPGGSGSGCESPDCGAPKEESSMKMEGMSMPMESMTMSSMMAESTPMGCDKPEGCGAPPMEQMGCDKPEGCDAPPKEQMGCDKPEGCDAPPMQMGCDKPEGCDSPPKQMGCDKPEGCDSPPMQMGCDKPEGCGMQEASSSMMMESSTSMMMEESSTSMMMESTSTMEEQASTSSAEMSMPSYGSGSSNWGNNGYDNCVQQCMASYAPPPSMYTPPPMENGYDTSAKGSSGKIYTVMIAPKKGVLRYVPFAVNAKVGDTIRFRWGAGPHTVTKGSELEPCNATSDNGFTSGKQNESFTFDQVVNDTNPTFLFCGVATHCEQGMFGIINPPSIENNAATSVASMLNATTDPALSAKIAMVSKATANSDVASNWGAKFDMAKIPEERRAAFLDNVLLTRVTMAENTDQIDNENFNPTNAFNMPDDFLAMDQAATAASANNAAASGPDAAASNSSPASSPTQSQKAGASRSVVTSSGAVVAVLAAAFFSL